MSILYRILENLSNSSLNQRKLIRFLIDAILLPISLCSCFLLFPEIFRLSLEDNVNLFILSIVVGLPLFSFTGQYTSLTRYVGSSSFYKLSFRNILLVAILISIGKIFNIYYLSSKAWFFSFILFLDVVFN